MLYTLILPLAFDSVSHLAKQSACIALYYRDTKEQYKPIVWRGEGTWNIVERTAYI